MKQVMKCAKAARQPVKSYNSFLFFWSGRFENDFHLSRINFNSSLGYHKPQKLPCIDAKGTLSWIEFHVVCSHKTECLFQVLGVLSLGFALYNNVVNVDYHNSTNQGLENFRYQPMVSSTSVLESKRHDFVTVQPLRCNKDCILLI